MDSLISLNGTESHPVDFLLNPVRIRRGVYGFSGTITFMDEDFSKYSAAATVSYSARNDNAFAKLPLSMPEGPLCDKLNNEYRRYLMKPLARASEMLDADTGDLCELFEKVIEMTWMHSFHFMQILCSIFLRIQKTYTVTNYELDTRTIPRFLQTGYYKVDVIVFEAITHEATFVLRAMLTLT